MIQTPKYRMPTLGRAVSLPTLRIASLIRDCQPAPFLRKKATTSGSSRSDTRVLTGFDFCGPRWPRKRRISSGRTSATGRNSYPSHGGLSGSRKAAAVIAASSSSVIRSALSRAMWRASSQLLGPASLRPLRLSVILSAFLLSSLAQADHPCHFAKFVLAFGKHQHVEIGVDEALRNLSQLTIIFSVINRSCCQRPVEPIDRGELDAMVLQILPALAFIPIVAHAPRPFHDFFVPAIKSGQGRVRALAEAAPCARPPNDGWRQRSLRGGHQSLAWCGRGGRN